MPKFTQDTEDRIVAACDALFQNGGKNIASVARQFEVSYDAIYRRFHGTPNQSDRKITNTCLNDTQDYALCEWICKQHKLGFPAGKKHVVAIAEWILKLSSSDGAPLSKPLSKHWYARWSNRHPEFHDIITKLLENARKSAALNASEIEHWFELLRLCM